MTTPFRPDELEGAEGITPEDLAGEARIARELETAAGRTPVLAPTAFADRVMAVIAHEPAPAPARAAGHALRTGALAALLVSIRDAFRVTFSGGFPAVVRAQALAVALVVVAVSGGVTYGAASALGLLERPSTQGPVELPSTGPSVSPDASQLEVVPPTPSVSPSPSVSPESPSDEASEPPDDTGTPDAATPKATRTPKPTSTAAHGGSGAPEPTKRPERTPRPTPRPTPKPTTEPTDDHDGGGESPDATRTPRPTETPKPTGGSGDG